MADIIKKPGESRLWDQLYDMWDKGENRQEELDKLYDYWDGKYELPPDTTYSDTKKTNCNICKQIVETKLSAMLDAQFSIAVVPELNSFSDFKTMKDQQACADILNDEVHNVLKANSFDSIKEKVGRWGLVGGFGASQTTFESEKEVEGNIKIVDIDPRELRWNAKAKKFEDLTFIAYKVELNPQIVKKMYAQDAEGNWNKEMCDKIDAITETDTDVTKGDRKGVVVGQSSETTDLAYAYDSKGIVVGKVVKLIVMFLLDDSISAPEQGDSEELSAEKQAVKRMYPNGRMAVFSMDKSKKVIFDDRAAPEGFMSLGNIDFFNPTDFAKFTGKGEVEDLTAIQDRINGAYLKIRILIANHIKAIGLDADLDAEMNDTDLVNHPVIFLEGLGRDKGKVPPMISNDTLSDVQQLQAIIDGLKREAKDLARVNDTMLTGMRQTGTNSAEQVEALQESPMAGIRALQRNFKNYVIRKGEKIITLILNHYTVQRLISLSTGMTAQDITGQMQTAQTARIINREQTPKSEGGRYIELLTEAGLVIREIKLDPNWKFKVDVVAGTEIPRSRRENANLVEKLYTDGALGNPQDIDVKEQYFKAIDLPNYRAFISMMRRKLQELAQKPPQMPTIHQIMSNPDLAKAFAEILDGLKGFSFAKGQILKALGLHPGVDKIEDAPAQEITSKADVRDIASIAPDTISKNPVKVAQGTQMAQAIELLNQLSPERLIEVIGKLEMFVGGKGTELLEIKEKGEKK